ANGVLRCRRSARAAQELTARIVVGRVGSSHCLSFSELCLRARTGRSRFSTNKNTSVRRNAFGVGKQGRTLYRSRNRDFHDWIPEPEYVDCATSLFRNGG